MAVTMDLSELSLEEADMARAKKRAAVADSVRVASFVKKLTEASSDRAQFDLVLDELRTADDLTAADVAEIAQRFAMPGNRIGTRAAALSAISKRFIELARFRQKTAIAAKTRPW